MVAQLQHQILAQIITLVQQLSLEYRLRLLQTISQMLIIELPPKPRQLSYGKFNGAQMSTWQDFVSVEWQSIDKELNDTQIHS